MIRQGGRSLVCMRAPKEFGGQEMYSTWTYTKIVPMREIEYLHHFADKDGNRVDPVTLGLPPDMPEEVRNVVTFKAVGDHQDGNHRYGIGLARGSNDGDVQDGYGAVPR
jgi:hypothetical protein